MKRSFFLVLCFCLIGSFQAHGANVQDQLPSWSDGTHEFPPVIGDLANEWPGIGASILFDADTGTILQENNGDKIIPPASMTKLLTLALVFDHISAMQIKLDDLIDLPRETWSVNAPPRSSLMFLGRGQRATWRDLLFGLAVSSGNDAALAAAINVSGSLDAFVEAMNKKAHDLNLQSSSFVEPSGYSEQNRTTARDFSSFVFWYIRTYPEALEYHRTISFTYPRPENLPPGADPVYGPITQFNKNKLLESYEGLDGLKTGFIDESGYNLAFTARRDNMRLAGLVMGARSEDQRKEHARFLLDWGFANYASVALKAPSAGRITVFHSNKGFVDLPAISFRTTIPRVLLEDISYDYQVPAELGGPLKAGSTLGSVRWYSGSTQILELPVKLPVELSPAWPIYSFFDELYLRVRTLWGVPYPGLQ